MKEKVYIKNMVCDRCIMAVEQVFNKLNLPVISIELGEVEIPKMLSGSEKQDLKRALEQIGFELLEDKRERLVGQVKSIVIDLIHKDQKLLKINLSDYLAEKTGVDYSYLSKLFSELEQQTIEKYVINQKVEKVKELLSYNEQTLSEIADALHYSSVAHLSAQFKKVTSLTPSQYKSNQEKMRKPLDEI